MRSNFRRQYTRFNQKFRLRNATLADEVALGEVEVAYMEVNDFMELSPATMELSGTQTGFPCEIASEYRRDAGVPPPRVGTKLEHLRR
jgi:hypothetical protein